MLELDSRRKMSNNHIPTQPKKFRVLKVLLLSSFLIKCVTSGLMQEMVNSKTSEVMAAEIPQGITDSGLSKDQVASVIRLENQSPPDNLKDHSDLPASGPSEEGFIKNDSELQEAPIVNDNDRQLDTEAVTAVSESRQTVENTSPKSATKSSLKPEPEPPSSGTSQLSTSTLVGTSGNKDELSSIHPKNTERESSGNTQLGSTTPIAKDPSNSGFSSGRPTASSTPRRRNRNRSASIQSEAFHPNPHGVVWGVPAPVPVNGFLPHVQQNVRVLHANANHAMTTAQAHVDQATYHTVDAQVALNEALRNMAFLENEIWQQGLAPYPQHLHHIYHAPYSQTSHPAHFAAQPGSTSSQVPATAIRLRHANPPSSVAQSGSTSSQVPATAIRLENANPSSSNPTETSLSVGSLRRALFPQDHPPGAGPLEESKVGSLEKKKPSDSSLVNFAKGDGLPRNLVFGTRPPVSVDFKDDPLPQNEVPKPENVDRLGKINEEEKTLETSQAVKGGATSQEKGKRKEKKKGRSNLKAEVLEQDQSKKVDDSANGLPAGSSSDMQQWVLEL
ncbi:hypothetical protein CROQUDRAFT_95971 [Cronartium quercuum f. sp. fusiforme G11]|uniref:Uncharacterized protein n=1 Tax=Cronartium quercuum f. sp. fusiforme G11 TaxID=708437 RepID=A0A9P6NGF2_9BASI|nr:hypothetical protein CROQUDRAFT_95971 [Cronartium quercuum f. sp. fusiforme G11]